VRTTTCPRRSIRACSSQELAVRRSPLQLAAGRSCGIWNLRGTRGAYGALWVRTRRRDAEPAVAAQGAPPGARAGRRASVRGRSSPRCIAPASLPRASACCPESSSGARRRANSPPSSRRSSSTAPPAREPASGGAARRTGCSLGLTCGAAGAFEVGGGDVAEREHAGLPLDLERRRDLDRSVRHLAAVRPLLMLVTNAAIVPFIAWDSRSASPSGAGLLRSTSTGPS